MESKQVQNPYYGYPIRGNAWAQQAAPEEFQKRREKSPSTVDAETSLAPLELHSLPLKQSILKQSEKGSEQHNNRVSLSVESERFYSRAADQSSGYKTLYYKAADARVTPEAGEKTKFFAHISETNKLSPGAVIPPRDYLKENPKHRTGKDRRARTKPSLALDPLDAKFAQSKNLHPRAQPQHTPQYLQPDKYLKSELQNIKVQEPTEAKSHASFPEHTRVVSKPTVLIASPSKVLIHDHGLKFSSPGSLNDGSDRSHSKVSLQIAGSNVSPSISHLRGSKDGRPQNSPFSERISRARFESPRSEIHAAISAVSSAVQNTDWSGVGPVPSKGYYESPNAGVEPLHIQKHYIELQKIHSPLQNAPVTHTVLRKNHYLPLRDVRNQVVESRVNNKSPLPSAFTVGQNAAKSIQDSSSKNLPPSPAVSGPQAEWLKISSEQRLARPIANTDTSSIGHHRPTGNENVFVDGLGSHSTAGPVTSCPSSPSHDVSAAPHQSYGGSHTTNIAREHTPETPKMPETKEQENVGGTPFRRDRAVRPHKKASPINLDYRQMKKPTTVGPETQTISSQVYDHASRSPLRVPTSIFRGELGYLSTTFANSPTRTRSYAQRKNVNIVVNKSHHEEQIAEVVAPSKAGQERPNNSRQLEQTATDPFVSSKLSPASAADASFAARYYGRFVPSPPRSSDLPSNTSHPPKSSAVPTAHHRQAPPPHATSAQVEHHQLEILNFLGGATTSIKNLVDSRADYVVDKVLQPRNDRLDKIDSAIRDLKNGLRKAYSNSDEMMDDLRGRVVQVERAQARIEGSQARMEAKMDRLLECQEGIWDELQEMRRERLRLVMPSGTLVAPDLKDHPAFKSNK